MTRRKHTPFTALLNMCKKNGLYQKEDGTWAINSSTNRKRMEDGGRFGAATKNSKKWNPSKILITADDLEKQWEKQGKVCYWLKTPIDLELLFKSHPEWYPKHPGAPSVDRIDDNKDYTPDNIIITCRFANLGRNIYPYDRTIEFIEQLRQGMIRRVEKGNEHEYQT